MSEKITTKRQNPNGEVTMNVEEFQNFCLALDKREQEGVMPRYPAPARKFLWNELAGKAADIREAVLKWIMVGEKTELSVPELTVPEDFWTQPLAAFATSQENDSNYKRKISAKRAVITTTMLEQVRNMNYIAAAFTIDWLRREPRKALMVLHRGMI